MRPGNPFAKVMLCLSAFQTTLRWRRCTGRASYSPSGRPIHASMRSAGTAESEARLRLASRIPGKRAFESVVTSL